MWIRALLCLWLMMSGLPASAEQAKTADHINGSDSIKVDYAYWYSDERKQLGDVLELKAEQWTQVERATQPKAERPARVAAHSQGF